MSTYSKEHYEFLNKRKKEKRFIILFRIIIIVVILLLWELLSKYHIINTFLSSSPSKIINTIINLSSDGTLYNHIFITLYEVIISFVISVLIGFIIAVILWSNKILSKIIEPYITILNSLPKVALGPLIIIWVGASTNSIIFMALLINTFITIINIYNGFLSTNKDYIMLLRSLGARKKQVFTKAIFPSNLLNIVNSLKINISMSLIGVIMGELLVSKKGLGYLINYGSQVFNIDLVFSSIIILGIISYLMYLLIEKIELLIIKSR